MDEKAVSAFSQAVANLKLAVSVLDTAAVISPDIPKQIINEYFTAAQAIADTSLDLIDLIGHEAMQHCSAKYEPIDPAILLEEIDGAWAGIMVEIEQDGDCLDIEQARQHSTLNKSQQGIK